MIDSLFKHLDRALYLKPWRHYGLEPRQYGLVTLHRPTNIDQPEVVNELAVALDEIAATMPLLFLIHPRTLANGQHIWEKMLYVQITEPLGYLEFLGLMARARVLVTDSGGIQEETTALSVPCLTLRENTERPVTITRSTNWLVKPDAEHVLETVTRIDDHQAVLPDLWDGKAALRIVDAIQAWLEHHDR